MRLAMSIMLCLAIILWIYPAPGAIESPDNMGGSRAMAEEIPIGSYRFLEEDIAYKVVPMEKEIPIGGHETLEEAPVEEAAPMEEEIPIRGHVPLEEVAVEEATPIEEGGPPKDNSILPGFNIILTAAALMGASFIIEMRKIS